MISQTNALLNQLHVGSQPVALFITGSSGCGKTHLAKELERLLNPDRAIVHFFDRIGVPSPEVMIAEFGSGQRWQEVTTHRWVEQIAAIRDKALVIFEGQYHPKFLLDAVTMLGFRDFKLVVVTADEKIWQQRLFGPRNQPELVTDDMRNWARCLREETIKLGGTVIDTSASATEKNLGEITELINPMLKARLASV